MIPNLTGGLSSVMNLVPLPGKMTIIPLTDTDPIPLPAGLPYVVMFNPESLTEGSNPVFNDEQAPGTEGAQQRYNRTPAGHFSFDFLVDGTGASGDKREVAAEILLFKETVKLDGDQHRPNFLLIVFGTFIKTAVMTSMSVQYTMFRKNGTPLRAKISVSFKEHTPEVLKFLKTDFMSPDLTRRQKIIEGDTLPLLCHSIYDSPRFYLEVARANGLTSFRRLVPGKELIFPPIEK